MKIKLLYWKIIISAITLSGLHSLCHGQHNKPCTIKNLGDYTADGQSYTLTFEEKPQVSIYMVFFGGFDYRILICSPHIAKYRVTLYDIEKNILISEFCQNHEINFDIRFDSDLAAIVEISQRVENETQIIPGEIRFTVGFKDNKLVNFK